MFKIQITEKKYKKSPSFPVFCVKFPSFSNLLPDFLDWELLSHLPGFAVGMRTMTLYLTAEFCTYVILKATVFIDGSPDTFYDLSIND